MSNVDIQRLIGMPIAEFMNKFAGTDNPTEDAMCCLVYKLQIQTLMGMPIAEFLAQFAGAENSIEDAICWLLYKLQSDGTQIPQGFTEQARKHLSEG